MTIPPRSSEQDLRPAPITSGEAAYTIRPIRGEEWRAVRGFRLTALKDEIAHLAFFETHADALARPDSFWQERALGASTSAPNATARQFVAVDAVGTFVGTVVALLERVGDADVFGQEITRPAGQVVGVYVAPPHRGRGLIEQLTAACFAWIEESDLSVDRLFVHADNGHAQRVYEHLGFTGTGVSFTGPQGCELEMERRLPSAASPTKNP